MTNSVNMGDLAHLAQNLLNEQKHGQEFMLSDVYNLTRQAYEKHSEDPVIRQFAFVIERLVEKNGSSATINQEEITQIYNEFGGLSPDSRFREVLGALVFDSPVKTAETNTDYISRNRIDAEDSQLSMDDYIDQDLTNALSGVFGGSIDSKKAYNEKAAAKGAEYVIAELQMMGFKQPKVDVLGGNQKTLVYSAHLDTQRGLVPVAIPLDISSGKVLFPSTFVADERLEELTADKLNYFIDKKAFNNDFTMPSANAVLNAIGVATGQIRTASENEFNTTIERFEERGEIIQLTTPELFSNKQNYPEPQPYIDTTPEVEMPKELAHLAQDFENDLLESVSTFGRNAIRAGKSIVLAELAAAGFKHSQVRFGSEGEDSVCYLAVLHTPKGPAEIEIPVEMQVTADNRYTPLLPTCFAYDGLIEDFSAPKLQRFALNLPAPSSGQITYSTAHSYMTMPELRDEILKSASENDYVNCEIILGTIQERFNDEDYKNAIADYHNLLMLKNNLTQDQEVLRCSREIAAGKGSIETRCGHFGTPMSRVVVGEDGHCRLISSIERERLNPINEGGASISTSKLYWS